MIMDPFKRFRDIYLVEGKKDVSLPKINEMQDIPYFNNFDKEVLQYAVDYIENVEEGADPNEVADLMFNRGDGAMSSYYDGIQLLTNYNGDNGEGWTNGLEFLFDRGEDMGMDSDYIGSMIKDGRWDTLGNLMLLYKAEELLIASQILADAISSNRDLTAADIEDLEKELKIFIKHG